MTIPAPWTDTRHAVRLLFRDDVEGLALAEDGVQDEDAAFVEPQDLFDCLSASTASTSAHSTANKQYVSVELKHRRRRGRGSPRSQLPSLIVEVRPAPRTENHEAGAHNSQQAGIILPASYRRYFDQNALMSYDASLAIRTHHPCTISRAILAAASSSSFAYANSKSTENFANELDGKLIRQGDLVHVNGGLFQVVACEPTLQGLVKKDTTELFVTSSAGALVDEEQALTNGHHTLNQNTSQESLVNASNIVVDEQFLARGVFGTSRGAGDEDGVLFAGGVEATLDLRILANSAIARDALTAWGTRAGRDTSEMDLQSCILLDEAAFPMLAAVEGDWALIALEHSSRARVAKLLCAPQGLSGSASAAVHLSPLLLQCLNQGNSLATKKAQRLMLRTLEGQKEASTEEGPLDVVQDCPLTLPFADALTISRVAGPLSINRRYQSMFLSALRDYFQISRRVVQQDDIFAVKFDKIKVQWAAEAVEDGTAEDSHDVTTPLPWQSNLDQADGVVYFKVTDVVAELPEDTAENAARSMTGNWLQDVARTGQYGCVVDTTLTKLVQTGISRARVCDGTDWLDAASEIAPMPRSGSALVAPDSAYYRLMQLVEATLMPGARIYGLHLSVLLKGARGTGKRTVAHWISQRTGIHLVELNCFDLIGDTDAKTEGVLRARFAQAADCRPAILLLRHIDALARKSQSLETGQEPAMSAVLQDCIEELKKSTTSKDGQEASLPVAILGTTANADKCPTGVLACFKHEIAFDAPNEAERLSILETLLCNVSYGLDVSLKGLATQTAALVAADLSDLVQRAQLAAMQRIRRRSVGDGDASLLQAGVALMGDDFELALDKTRQSYSDNIGAPKIPNVTWDDVGGLASVKDDIMDTIQLPLDHPELFADGLKKRSGILLYGPPGTGKTLLAKAVATSCSLNFFSVKGPELLNMYIGESEANVRRVFQRARDAKPCVIFFDELDSIAPKRGNQGDSGGVMDRIVSQLLAELDGMSSGGGSSDVFVIGATNRPDLLDPALLRPGRFDRMLYLAVSGTHAEQLNILQALTRKFKLDSDVGDLSAIAEQCPLNLTGADFYALCSDAMLKSMTRKAEWIDDQVRQLDESARAKVASGAKAGHPVPLTTQYYLDEIASVSDLDVRVARADFEAALSELVPSVSAQEMQHYRSVQARFSSTDSDEQMQGDHQSTAYANGIHPPIEAAPFLPSGQAASSQTVGDLAEAMRRSQINASSFAHNSTVAASHSSSHEDRSANEPSHLTNGHSKIEISEAKEKNEETVSQPKNKSKGKGKARE